MEEKIEELSKPKLIEDLGYSYPNEKCKQKIKFGIYECPICNKHFKTRVNLINLGHTKSCGCYKKSKFFKGTSTHNQTKTILYKAWAGAKTRLYNQNIPNYNKYGGRGIIMCDEWKNDFTKFLDWALAKGYTNEYIKENKLSLDRIDVNGNYEPSNCRFADRTIQNRNQNIREDNTSGFKGVSYHKDRHKFQVSINVNKTGIYLGLYQTAVEGAIAYNNYILENNLEGFNLNIIPE